MKSSRASRKGFTLIELMVVVAIIAILTAIVTASFNQARANSRDAKRISDLANIQLALELLFDRCNGYPSALSNPTSGVTVSTCPSGVNLGTFLSQIPSAPNAGETYSYGVNGSPATDYVLMATLEGNNSVLSSSDHTNAYGIICTPALAYCVVPK